MKKILFFISFFVLLLSCNKDYEDKYHLEFMPVTEVDIPSSFEIGQTYPIRVKYNRPTTCHMYDGMYFEKEQNIRVFAIRNLVFERSDCQDLFTNSTQIEFNFTVLNSGNYIFKFWKGKDNDGNDIFEEYDIPVID